MSWTRPQDLKAQLQRLWDRGLFLRNLVNQERFTPIKLTLHKPGSADISERFADVRTWAAALETMPLTINWAVVNHRVQGSQRLPDAVWIRDDDDIKSALDWLGKTHDYDRFAHQVAITESSLSELLPWLEKRPLQALELYDDWAQLLAVVSWFQAHPRPAIYLRQIDLPGLHTKFIERHLAVLTELLDLALPPEVIDFSKTGVKQFCARYGLLDKPVGIRFRILDPQMQLLPGTQCPDITLDADNFSRLQRHTHDIQRVFITENETNFLAFPMVPHSLVIFGKGYGWDALARSQWLHQCRIHYWGDIDTHGFDILDKLRKYFSHVESLLMDRATLDSHQVYWGTEDTLLNADLARLTPEEHTLYDDLRHQRIRAGLRLEQEHVGFHWLHGRLTALLAQR